MVIFCVKKEKNINLYKAKIYKQDEFYTQLSDIEKEHPEIAYENSINAMVEKPYRLCDRDFDCERCPLDVALRGTAPEVRMDPPGATGPWSFPTDRTYAAGHLWIAPAADGGASRLGLDAFAAGLLGACRRVRPSRRPTLRTTSEARPPNRCTFAQLSGAAG